MDQRMFNAACSGDVSMLHQLLQENPFILSDYTLMNISNENPLTIATKANQLSFVREILKHNPQLAMELNQDGVHPLDLASAYGNVEIATEILAAVGPEICRRPGRDGRTALHHAAMNGRIEIIDRLISASSDSAKDVTTFGQTAIHLAIKHFKFEALRCLLQWLEKVDNMKEVVNWGDKEGNTALHYAASRKQLECVEVLLDWNDRAGNTLELNAVNKRGLTTIDIVDILIESSNDHVQLMRQMFLRGSAPSSSDKIDIVSEKPKPEADSKESTNDHEHRPPTEKPKKFWDIVEFFRFKWGRDPPGEARATLLVVLALIVTVTFQAGINPPTVLFDRSTNTSLASITVFMVTNTVAFSTAATTLEYLTGGLPFQRELGVSLFAMGGAYGWSLTSTKPTGTVRTVLLYVALAVPFLLRLMPYMMKTLRLAN